MHRRHFTAFIAAAALAASAGSALAQQDYPSRSIKLIVDGAAGGINDIWARRYGQRLSEQLKQTVIVENRVGASGTLSVEALLSAPADGYTLFYGGLNPLVIYPATGGQVRYDPLKDVVPVALSNMGFPTLVVGAGFGARTLAEAVAKAKAAEQTCGTVGNASLQHFACAAIERAATIKLLSVPYKTGALAITEAAGGQIGFAVGYMSEIEALIGAGKLVPLAVYGPKRLPKLPNVPTMAEAGYPGIELFSFAGFFFPANTPMPIVNKMNAELVTAMTRSTEMQDALRFAGGLYEPLDQPAFAQMYRNEIQRWRKMSTDFNIRVAQ
ncbi:MAG TPA: tripartite tricarboxylate transporter substrate binding protein [Rubrivivax sp.]|nr:tripartite tricarboxylate transporter substrate binding protein [Rubrivivax sp.]